MTARRVRTASAPFEIQDLVTSVRAQRAWARHQVITDPEHKAAAAGLRRQRVGMLRPVPGPDPEVEQRSLAVYDALAGGDGEGAA